MIEVKNLTRYYGTFAALNDVSFSIREGEIIGLLGLNGAGKSTTLKILAGLITPSEGEFRFDGHDVTENPELVRSRIGYLPESPPLYKDMTVTAFLTHIGRLKGMSAADVQRRLPGILELAQLQGREHQIIDTLSHGYRKRVGIAQAVLHDPKLVILDEPISGLDPRQIVGMRDVIRGLADGRAVIISSHILSEISQTCDRILVIVDGKLVAEGTEAELVERMAARSIHDLNVTVKGDLQSFPTWLAAHESVQAVEPLPSAPDTLTMNVRFHTAEGRTKLVPDLLAAGYTLWLMEDPENDLEEIFLGLTGEAA